MGPEILSNTRAGVWIRAPGAFADSNSILDVRLSQLVWTQEGSKKGSLKVVCLAVGFLDRRSLMEGIYKGLLVGT